MPNHWTQLEVQKRPFFRLFSFIGEVQIVFQASFLWPEVSSREAEMWLFSDWLRDFSPITTLGLQISPILWHNRLPMGHRLPNELLDELRTYLQHFDQTGHLAESDSVEEIKRRLRGRIAEVEAVLRHADDSHGTSTPSPNRGV
jgi:hypothetical protein